MASDVTKEERDAFLASLAITVDAQFVPQSLSRNRDEKSKTLNWRLKLSRAGYTMEVEYSQGIGHVPGYNDPGTNPRLRRSLIDKKWRDAQDNASETGKYPARRGTAVHHITERLPEPKLDDVLYCLVSDASAADMTFEEWANDFGYDTDSRKAEATYRACAETGIKLRRLVGGAETLAKLQDIFQGY